METLPSRNTNHGRGARLPKCLGATLLFLIVMTPYFFSTKVHLGLGVYQETYVAKDHHLYHVANSANPKPRRFIANVCSAYNHTSAQLTSFRKEIKNTGWSNLHVREGKTFVNNPKLNAMGINVCFYYAMLDAAEKLDEFDYLLFFEDDALIFKDSTWPGIAENDLDKRLDILESVDGKVLMLGGHGFKGVDKNELDRAIKVKGITKIGSSWGAYGMVIRKEIILELVKIFKESLEKKGTDETSHADAIDNLIPRKFPGMVYASVPLMVDHPNGKYSDTWKKIRKFKWAGKSEWYRVQNNVEFKKIAKLTPNQTQSQQVEN